MKRHAGVLLSITSLPSKYGIGCFDQAAYDFVDWLEKTGQKYWQILPLGSTSHGGAYDSPYQAFSAFAGNPYMIDLDFLCDEGLLKKEEYELIDWGINDRCVDYGKIFRNRTAVLKNIFPRFRETEKYRRFCDENAFWLDDYALFMALRDFFGGAPWTEWPDDIRKHYPPAVAYYHEKLYYDVHRL